MKIFNTCLSDEDRPIYIRDYQRKSLKHPAEQKKNKKQRNFDHDQKVNRRNERSLCANPSEVFIIHA